MLKGLKISHMTKILFFFTVIFFSFQSYAKVTEVNSLRVDNKVAPLAVASLQPVFSWQLLSSERNVMQSAYRILIADDLKLLAKEEGNIWDSKKINSSASIQVKYKEKNLKAGNTYYWKVMIWDQKGRNSKWSEASSFGTGLYQKEDWMNAKWIALDKIPDSLINILPIDGHKEKHMGNNVLPIFRKSFSVKKNVKKATLFISGLGHFEASLNGEKIGDHFLDAGWVKYDKEALYETFDLTSKLKEGENALGVMLGNGFYYIPPVKGRYRKLKGAFGFPKMISRLHIQYQDGSSENIISNESWKTAKSPITFSSIYGGEDYDANLEQKGWNNPGFDDRHWKNVIITEGAPLLNPQAADALKVLEKFKAKSITKTPNGNWVYDLGQNASGIISLKVKGKKGDTIRVYPAELIKDSSVNQKASGSPYYFEYILKGDGIEVWQPRFSYYGFRYLELRGGAPTGKDNPNKSPEVIELKGLHTRNAARRVGAFSSSSELFNKTDKLIDWAIKSNMASVFTDCPHREKLGWLEQTHLMISSVMYNYDITNLGKKVINDAKNSQLENGLIPEIAPEYVHFTWGGDIFRDSPEWGSSTIVLPWYLYQWYGDKDVFEKAYPTMQRYITYLQSKADNHILKQGLGDWFDLGPERPGVSQLTPMGVTGTAIYYYDLTILQKIAALLGKQDDVLKYKELAEKVKTSFNQTFFNQQTKQYASGSQTSNAMALYMNLVEPNNRAAVLENLIKDIRSKNNALTAGDIGYRYVLKVLEEAGRSDVIYDMNSRTDVPGYGYQIEKGATALTESWQALPNVSNNHFMLGHFMEWLYSGLAGIRIADDAVGFNKIKIYPEPVGDVKFANATYDSAHGLISSDWKIEKGVFELKVIIPANTSATIYLPSKEGDQVIENKKSVYKNKELQILGYDKGRLIIKVGSGAYHFKVSK
jgi:alpha-L-rhamnosidase